MSMSIRVILVAVLCFAPLSVFAQTDDSDNPNDWQDWRYSSGYQALTQQLGTVPVAALPIPVLLGVDVSDLTRNFGDARGGGTRLHEGLDIMAPEGTPVVSPTQAVVTRVGNGANSGLYVRTANPGGETFVYMHLSAIPSSIVAGKSLQRGEVLGFVGNTGNASGTHAHLHFEIRSNRIATDPFPRLTQTFSLSERMQGVAQSLERSASSTLAGMLVEKFRSTFLAAQAQGLPLAQAIVAQLGTVAQPATRQSVSAASGGAGPVFGDESAVVVTLQQALIVHAAGPVAVRLRSTGATGYFGPLTREALSEYQRVAGLSVTGTADTGTLAHLSVTQTTSSSVSSAVAFARDLEVGMRGEDVRALQRFLNAHGFVIIESGAGSPGNESDYFGLLTRAALARYQKAKSILPTAGYLGSITRASITAES